MSGTHTPRLTPGTYHLTKGYQVDEDGRERFIDMPDGEYVEGFGPGTRTRVTRVLGADDTPATLEPDRTYPDGALWITGEDVSVAVHLVEGHPQIWVGNRRYSLAAARRLTRVQQAAVRHAEQLAADPRTDTADA